MSDKVEDKGQVKEKKESEVTKVDALAATGTVHHVVRTISLTNTNAGGAMPVHEVNTYINEFLAAGWRLNTTHYLEKNEFGYTMLWVLDREWK